MLELRLTDPDEYTVPGAVHTVPDDQADTVRAWLLAEENPMSIPTIVAQRPVVAGDKQLTVSTIRIAADYYDTVIFDDSTDKRHRGQAIGGYVIDFSSKRASDRDSAMEQHREALIAARTEQPRRIA